MLKIDTFAEIEPEFIERAHAVVWCNGATVDTRGRPRTRVLHPIWERRNRAGHHLSQLAQGQALGR